MYRLPVLANPIALEEPLRTGDMDEQKLRCRYRNGCLDRLARTKAGALDCRACPIEAPIDADQLASDVAALADLAAAIIRPGSTIADFNRFARPLKPIPGARRKKRRAARHRRGI